MSKPMFPNQRSITIHKPRSKPGEFTYINTAAALAAMKDLSYSTYMLYSFLNLNADQFEYCPSQSYIAESIDLKRNTYYKAMCELEAKGYLHPRKESPTRFDFYEVPKKGDSNTKKQDDTSQKMVENINNKIVNNESPALSLNATGGVQTINNSLFDDF